MARERNEDYISAFSNRVKELRKAQKFTLNELGKSSKFDLHTIDRIERSHGNVTLSTILALAKGLNIHPKELFDFDHSEFL